VTSDGLDECARVAGAVVAVASRVNAPLSSFICDAEATNVPESQGE
jgi:hypothetical protein